MSSNEPEVVSGGSSSTKLLAVALLLVTFVAGGVIGFVADRAFQMTRSHMAPRSPQFLVERLDRRLNLTDQQRAQVTQIVERHQARISSIWSGVRPQVRQELEAANAEIAQILTPQQRKNFEDMRLRLPPHRGPGGHMRRGESERGHPGPQ